MSSDDEVIGVWRNILRRELLRHNKVRLTLECGHEPVTTLGCACNAANPSPFTAEQVAFFCEECRDDSEQAAAELE